MAVVAVSMRLWLLAGNSALPAGRSALFYEANCREIYSLCLRAMKAGGNRGLLTKTYRQTYPDTCCCSGNSDEDDDDDYHCDYDDNAVVNPRKKAPWFLPHLLSRLRSVSQLDEVATSKRLE